MTSSVSSLYPTVSCSGGGRRQRNRSMGRQPSNRDDHGGGVIATASPELLYASGRITAGRYHEMLAETNGREGGGSAAGGAGVGTSSPDDRNPVEPAPRKIGGKSRGERETSTTTSVGHA